MKKCPYCAEEIQDKAIKCKHCKEFLKKPQGSAGIKKHVFKVRGYKPGEQAWEPSLNLKIEALNKDEARNIAKTELEQRGEDVSKYELYLKKLKGPKKCPKCGSSNIGAMKKGFSFGKAATGGLLLGPVGLIGGAIGKNKINIVCNNCGYKW